MNTRRTPAIQFIGVSRHFGEVHAVDHVDLEIADGEFFTLLGPSGSGKTTCLRMVAGFDHPTSGQIFLHGQEVSSLPPYERQVNTVFQDYALFPHMTVLENVAYGLMVRNVAKAKRELQAEDMLKVVRLPGLGTRKPSQLSGGQRQRVALARALILKPRVLLLDEPLGALDLKLRQEMQVELKELQEQVGITFVYVTHDQEEALTMSDRLAVFNQGKIEQVGSPAEIYESPATEFVAGFVGVSNLITGQVAKQIIGVEATFTVRPEKIHFLQEGEKAPKGTYTTTGRVADVVYLGMYTRYQVEIEGGNLLTVAQQNLTATSSRALSAKGQQVRLFWEKEHCKQIERR
ncbi:MAG: ABC transporter ATP-binding protein [Anaerolineales bacterium]